MNRYIAIPALLAFIVTLILGPGLIRFLHRLKFGQFIQEDGPQSHLKKSGTPTMGGVLFLVGILVGSLPFVMRFPKIIPVLFVTMGFGLVGFLDDYIKIVMKRNLGLTPAQKMAGQFVVTAVFAFYMIRYSGLSTDILIPFTGGRTVNLGILYVPILFFVVLGTVNGANFTDGLDGLASSVTVIIAVFFTVIAATAQYEIYPVTSAVIGALLGFLCFNTYPAKVFMGDTGSLALGGFVASAAFMVKGPLLLPIVAFIYFVEVLSVIIQVSYYKRTKKRVFKMAPIHHHFELSGWPETKVVSIFSIVTAVLCLLGMLAY
jgi:phospho-N-acetylmuramoyl-pentapeptide-transferase